MRHPHPLPFAALALALLASTAYTRPAQPTTGPTTVPVTQAAFPRPGTDDRAFAVSPALADGPTAAPANSLWPGALAYTRDNAAPLYLAGMLRFPELGRERLAIENRLQEATPDTIDAAEAEEYLKLYDATFQALMPTLSRPRVEWDWPWREQGYLTLLPHLNQMRHVANVLTHRVKLNLSRGDARAALDPIRQMYVMGAHAGAHDEAILVEGLVGVGISALATSHTVMVTGRPDAPSLYHALLALPEPMFRPRTWVETEHRVFRDSVPALYEPAAMNEATWSSVWRTFAAAGLSEAGWKYNDLPEGDQKRLARELAASRRETMIPAAVAYFTERGGDAAALRAEAEATPYPLLARYMTATMDAHMDKAATLVGLPFVTAFPRLRQLTVEGAPLLWTRSESDNRDHDLDLPFDRGLIVVQRLRQRIAAVVVLEALRDHAAKTDRWPDALEQVELYIPPDPMTGRPFEYRRDGDRFMLRGTGDPQPERNFEWRVTLRP